ncbi:hypothetical protein ACR3K2_29610 [Cryptosporidium serpentis]
MIANICKLFAILVIAVYADGPYSSPRQARLEAMSVGVSRFPEPNVSGVFLTPNIRPSEASSFFNDILNKSRQIPFAESSGGPPLIVESTSGGSISIFSRSTPGLPSDALFYYPLISSTKSGMQSFCKEERILIYNIEQTLNNTVSNLVSRLPEGNSKEVYRQVLDDMVKLCSTQREKVDAISRNISNIEDDKQVNADDFSSAFVIAKEDDTLAYATMMFVGHVTPPPSPVTANYVPSNLFDMKKFLDRQLQNISTYCDNLYNAENRIEGISAIFQRQKMRRIHKQLKDNCSSERYLVIQMIDDLKNKGELDAEFINLAREQSNSISSLGSDTEMFLFQLNKYSPGVPLWSRDAGKSPEIIKIGKGYGIAMRTPSVKYEEFLANLIELSEAGDSDAENALLIQQASIQATDMRNRAVLFSATQFFNIMEERANSDLLKSSEILDQSQVDEESGSELEVTEVTSEALDSKTDEILDEVGEAEEVEEVEEVEIIGQGEGGEDDILVARKLAEDISLEGDDDVVSEDSLDEEEEEEVIMPSDTPEKILEVTSNARAYSPAKYAALTCSRQPSATCRRADGSPINCLKATCVTKECRHAAVHTLNCKDVAYIGTQCKMGHSVGGKSQRGHCVGGASYGGECTPRRWVGCTTELPALEGCVVKPAHSVGGQSKPSRITGITCQRKEIFPNIHCKAGEYKKGHCVDGQSKVPESRRGTCKVGTFKNGECALPHWQKGKSAIGEYRAGECYMGQSKVRSVKHQCQGGYSVGPKIRNGVYTGAQCKAGKSTPAKCVPSSTGSRSVPPKSVGAQSKPAKLVGGRSVPPKLEDCQVKPFRFVGGKSVPARITGTKCTPPHSVGPNGESSAPKVSVSKRIQVKKLQSKKPKVSIPDVELPESRPLSRAPHSTRRKSYSQSSSSRDTQSTSKSSRDSVQSRPNLTKSHKTSDKSGLDNGDSYADGKHSTKEIHSKNRSSLKSAKKSTSKQDVYGKTNPVQAASLAEESYD